MRIIFEVKDKTGRSITLTDERGKHIFRRHDMVDKLERIEETLKRPVRLLVDLSSNVGYYYRYYKEGLHYLKVIVKYLNGNGYVITSYLTRNIK